MKVTKVEKTDKFSVYKVTLEPNWFEKLFGIKPKTEEFKASENYYIYGGQNCYLNKDGSERGNNDYISKEIDKFRRSW